MAVRALRDDFRGADGKEIGVAWCGCLANVVRSYLTHRMAVDAEDED
jgi:hypothetical protein